MNNNSLKKVYFTRVERAIEMLSLGRIDAVLTDIHVGQYLVKNHFPGQFAPIKPSFRSTPAYFVFAKKEKFKALVPKFDGVLMQMMIDGRYKAVFDRYTK